MFKFLQSKKGFTIVELIIVLALLSLGVAAIGNMFKVAYRAFDKAEERYVKQEAAKTVAQYFQQGGAGLSAATKVELYNTIDVLPAEETSVKGFNYLYINPEDGYLYSRPSGSTKPIQLSDVKLYIEFNVVPYTTVINGVETSNKTISRGVSCFIGTVEEEFKYTFNAADELIPPDVDEVYYSLDVAYHFPNMIENNVLYVNQTYMGVDVYERSYTNVKKDDGTEKKIPTVDENAILVKYITDVTLSGDQLLTENNIQLYCFIATASYGVNNGEGVVGLLCDFRDKVLLTNPLGEAFVEAYYKLSPPVADVIAESEGLKSAVRLALKPLIVVAVNALDEDVARESAPWFAAFMLCGAGSTAMLIKISKQRKKAKRTE